MRSFLPSRKHVLRPLEQVFLTLTQLTNISVRESNVFFIFMSQLFAVEKSIECRYKANKIPFQRYAAYFSTVDSYDTMMKNDFDSVT